MKLYKIRDWSELFENNRTRDMKAMAWIPVPNNHDGYGYTTVVGRKNGAAIYGAWMVILQVASKCEPRGTLLRSPQQPHDAASISRMTRIPEQDIQNALDICSEETQWLEVTEVVQIPHLPAEIPHPPAERPPPSPQATDEERRKEGMEGTEGTEGKEQNGNSASAPSVTDEDSKPSSRFQVPPKSELDFHALKIGLPQSEADKFFNHYESNGWKVGQNKMKSWRPAMSGWKTRWEEKRTNGNNSNPNKPSIDRNAGTANEGQSAQYEGVGRLPGIQYGSR